VRRGEHERAAQHGQHGHQDRAAGDEHDVLQRALHGAHHEQHRQRHDGGGQDEGAAAPDAVRAGDRC
jgi:hypothetical protein